jgi:CubicO group peptidase (beta-lactamase class C family)
MQVAEEQIDPATGKVILRLVPQKRLMTVLDLLCYTSGIVYPPQFRDTEIHNLYRKAVFARDKTLADFVASLGALPLAHQPGEVWEYSWSTDVLARAVEVVSGQSFDQFLQGRIFDPLRMIDTGFHVPETTDPTRLPGSIGNVHGEGFGGRFLEPKATFGLVQNASAHHINHQANSKCWTTQNAAWCQQTPATRCKPVQGFATRHL